MILSGRLSDKHKELVGLPGFARDLNCQLCLYVSLFLFLSISPKPNYTLDMPAC
jgi:hypothetical protein